MRLHPGMKAGLLLLAIAGTIAATSETAHARRWRGYYGNGYGNGYYGGYYGNRWNGGWGGGYGWYGGYPAYGYGYNNYGYAAPGYAYGTTMTNYAPTYGNQPAMVYGQGGCGNTTTTAAYPPSGPMPATPGGYNGTAYDGGQTYDGANTPTYAPGTNAPPVNRQGNYAPAINGQMRDNANDHNAATNPPANGTPQPGTAANNANDHNATSPPPPPASAPAPSSSSSDTANQHNTNP